MKKVLFYNIQWDENQDELPKELTLDINSSCDIDQDGAEILSQETGSCVLEFLYKVVD